MSLKLSQYAELGSEKSLSSEKHSLFVVSEYYKAALPFQASLDAKLKRSQSEFKDLAITPLLVELPNGGVASITDNVIVQGPNSPNRAIISFSTESAPYPG